MPIRCLDNRSRIAQRAPNPCVSIELRSISNPGEAATSQVKIPIPNQVDMEIDNKDLMITADIFGMKNVEDN